MAFICLAPVSTGWVALTADAHAGLPLPQCSETEAELAMFGCWEWHPRAWSGSKAAALQVLQVDRPSIEQP